jgi:hypothetical protein
MSTEIRATFVYFFFFLNLGRINLGDMVVSVNGNDLKHSSQTDAITYLRLAAQSGHVTLVIDNSQEAQ